MPRTALTMPAPRPPIAGWRFAPPISAGEVGRILGPSSLRFRFKQAPDNAILAWRKLQQLDGVAYALGETPYASACYHRLLPHATAPEQRVLSADENLLQYIA